MSVSASAEVLSLDTPLTCACEPSELQVQVSAPDLVLLCCPRCGTIVAGQPVPGEAGPVGLRPLSLSEQESEQVRQSVKVATDAPLENVLEVVLQATLPISLRVAQTRLGVRPGLLTELRDALDQTQGPARFLTLQLVARMPVVPRELRSGALRAIGMSLGGDPLGAEVLVALMALYALAESGARLRSQVERVLQRISPGRDELANQTAQIAKAVLTKLDLAETERKQRVVRARGQLIQLVREERLAEAQAVLTALYPEDDPDDPDGGMISRMELCEAAAAQLGSGDSDRAARRTLLSWALQCAEVFASWATSGGEGMARMLAVNRLRDRLKQTH